MVEIDAVHATLTSAVGPPDIRLWDCGRWPMNRDCGQECLAQLDVAPDDCLARGILMRWYRSKSCVYCDKHFDAVHWADHQPALQTPNGNLVEWKDVSLGNLKSVMATHQPVCWNCFIARSFWQNHPDLVVYRHWTSPHRAGQQPRL
jgi:hypothetical protein